MNRKEWCRRATIFQELARTSAVKSRSQASLNFSNFTFSLRSSDASHGCSLLTGGFLALFLWSPLGEGRFQMDLITLRALKRIHPSRRSSDAALMLNKREPAFTRLNLLVMHLSSARINCNHLTSTPFNQNNNTLN